MSAVRQERVRRGLSQKELARLAGVDARTLRKIETGAYVSDVSRSAVERVLGVSATREPDTLAGATEKPSVLKFFFGAAGVPCLFWLTWLALGNWDPNPIHDLLFALCVAVTSLFAFFSLPFGFMYFSPPVPDTRIEIGFDASRPDVLVDPSALVRSWLGSDNLGIGQVSANPDGFKVSVFGSFPLSAYPGIVERLRNFGAVATVSRLPY